MWERIVKREKENRKYIVVASAMTMEPLYCAGWKHRFGSIRFLESSSLMTALPLGTPLVRMAIGIRDSCRGFAWQWDPVPHEYDVEMAYATPIGRIDGVKSLVPRQFLTDFVMGPPYSGFRVGTSSENPTSIIMLLLKEIKRMMWTICLLFFFKNLHLLSLFYIFQHWIFLARHN